MANARFPCRPAATGAARWSVKLDEQITRLCAGGPDRVLAIGRDERARVVRRSDGAVVAQEPAPKACQALETDRKQGTPPTRKHDLKLGGDAGADVDDRAEDEQPFVGLDRV